MPPWRLSWDRRAFARAVYISTLALAALSSGSTVEARSVQKFPTYGQAITSLLNLDTPGGGADNRITCSLYGDVFDASVRPNGDVLQFDNFGAPSIKIGEIGDLSPELANHCTQNDGNTVSGSGLGGGLFSFQGTRTVSQFVTRRARLSAPSSGGSEQDVGFGDDLTAFFFGGLQRSAAFQGADAAEPVEMAGALDLAQEWPDGTVVWRTPELGVFASFEYIESAYKETPFQVSSETREKTGRIGAAYRVTPYLTLGASGFYGHSDGETGALALFDLETDNEFLTFNYESICGLPESGETDGDEFGGSVFGVLQQPSGGAFLSFEIAGARREESYSRSLCLIASGAIPDALNEIYAGTIEGRPDSAAVDSALNAGYDVALGPLIFGPRVGLDVSYQRVGAYSETETISPFATTPMEGDVATTVDPDGLEIDAGLEQYATGAALAYDAQETWSVQSRVGLSVAAPLRFDDIAVTPFARAYYLHEFANDQTEVVARFAGDNRGDDASYFSFLTNEPDRDFFEVEGGLALAVDNGVNLFLGGGARLGDEYADSYSLQGAVTIPLN